MTAAVSSTAGALEGLRVLEVASPFTQYCGKMLAELGAEVILVEPPGGALVRQVPPWIGGVPGTERSLAYNYFNTSKQGITLDLSREQGQALFHRLAASVDIVLEGEKPGVMASRNCGYAQLSALKPSLIMTSVTGFGQNGPWAQYEAEDLVGLASGGFLYLGGFPDTPPVGAYGNQAFLGAAMYAAVGTLLAVTNMEVTGQGDHVDVSMQESMVTALENAVQFYDLEGKVKKRHAGEQRWAGTAVFECKDGYIYMMASGIGANKFWPLSLQWMIDEKIPGVERLMGEEWHQAEYVITEEAKRIFADIFGPWCRTQKKQYLFEEGQRRHIPMAAINSVADLLSSPQLAHRNFFVEVTHPESERPLRMPGPPYQLMGTPWKLRGPAPRLGQHNAQVYGSLGLSSSVIEGLTKEGIL